MSAGRQSVPVIPVVEEERRAKPLSNCVQIALERYFRDLDGHKPCQDLYDFVIDQVEYPLLKSVMEYARGNQSRAAEILGINRSTLRKKLERHDLNR
jgi:Fis family transcriptional regulator, factor for inversion stimulation protein